jgi:hypothetical protein
MKVVEIIGTNCDGNSSLEVMIDSEVEFSVNDHYQSDNTLSDAFNDCYKISKLLQKAYEAGKRGEPFTLLSGSFCEYSEEEGVCKSYEEVLTKLQINQSDETEE